MRRNNLILLITLSIIISGVLYSCKKDTSNDIEETTKPPSALFSANPLVGVAPFTVNFTDSSKNNPTVWLWSFGDGENSTLKNPSHTYYNAGTYSVTLTVSNNAGSDSLSNKNYIVVNNDFGTPPDGYFTDERDGQVYSYIKIGTQTWMAENLNFETTNSWCYDNIVDNGDIYGRLYKWEDAKSACPNGWHLASDEEWIDLEMNLGMDTIVLYEWGWRGTDQGRKLKSVTGWHESGNGSNSSGFNALPSGAREPDEDYYSLEYGGRWWTSSKEDSDRAWARGLRYDVDLIFRDHRFLYYAFSVRCVKD